LARYTVTLTLPLGELLHAGFQADPRSAQHVDCQCQTMGQRRALMRLRAGLEATGARLDNGRRVLSNADAIRYVLELLAESDPEG
jgi:hypothetical protein